MTKIELPVSSSKQVFFAQIESKAETRGAVSYERGYDARRNL